MGKRKLFSIGLELVSFALIIFGVGLSAAILLSILPLILLFLFSIEIFVLTGMGIMALNIAAEK